MHFKRMQVVDLFYGSKNQDVEQWIDASKELPEGKQGLFKIKRQNGSVNRAYYFKDKCEPLANLYYKKTSHWWDKETKEPLHDVVEWGKTKEED